MASNFELIGVLNDNDVDAFINHCLQHGDSVRAGNGVTVRWSDSSGAGVYSHIEDDEVVCVTPWFRDAQPVEVEFTGYLPDSECIYCSGCQFHMLEQGEMVFPFNVQIADIEAVRPQLPSGAERVELRATFFGQDVAVFANEDEFHASQSDDEVSFASQSFIPAGMFGGLPSAAFFTGIVESAETRTNTVTDVDFVHARVATLAFTADVLLSAYEIREVRPGQVVSGEFWACGVL